MKSEYNKKESNHKPASKSDLFDLADVITKAPEFVTRWDVVCGSDIPLNNYKIPKILEVFKSQFHMGFSSFKTNNLKLNPDYYRVKLNSHVMFAIACFAECSSFKLRVFGSQSKVIETF